MIKNNEGTNLKTINFILFVCFIVPILCLLYLFSASIARQPAFYWDQSSVKIYCVSRNETWPPIPTPYLTPTPQNKSFEINWSDNIIIKGWINCNTNDCVSNASEVLPFLTPTPKATRITIHHCESANTGDEWYSDGWHCARYDLRNDGTYQYSLDVCPINCTNITRDVEPWRINP